MNDTALSCTECGRRIAPEDGVWYRPFAGEQPKGRLLDDLTNRLSTSDNGGSPFHRDCLRRIAPELKF